MASTSSEGRSAEFDVFAEVLFVDSGVAVGSVVVTGSELLLGSGEEEEESAEGIDFESIMFSEEESDLESDFDSVGFGVVGFPVGKGPAFGFSDGSSDIW